MRWDQFQHPVVNLDPHYQTLTPISEKTMSQKRGREPLPKKKFRPATPKPATEHPPLLEAPAKITKAMGKTTQNPESK